MAHFVVESLSSVIIAQVITATQFARKIQRQKLGVRRETLKVLQELSVKNQNDERIIIYLV